MSTAGISLNPSRVSHSNHNEVNLCASKCLDWITVAITVTAIAVIAFALLALATGVGIPLAGVFFPVGLGLIALVIFYNIFRCPASSGGTTSLGTRHVTHFPEHHQSAYGSSVSVPIPPPVPSRNNRPQPHQGNSEPAMKSGWGNATAVPTHSAQSHQPPPPQPQGFHSAPPVNSGSAVKSGWGNATAVPTQHVPQPPPPVKSSGSTPYANQSHWGKDKKT